MLPEAFFWNSGSVDLASFRQYLEITTSMFPSPSFVLQVDPDTSCRTVNEVVAVASELLDCTRECTYEQRPFGSALLGVQLVDEEAGRPGFSSVPIGSRLEIDFNLQGTRRLRRVTSDNVGRRLAVLVDGQIISVLSLHLPAKESITFRTTLSKEQAEDLASRLRPEAAVPADGDLAAQQATRTVTIASRAGSEDHKAGK